MSFVRFGEDNSDVYVYESAMGLECCGCKLNKTLEFKYFSLYSEMIEHLQLHQDQGHQVPEFVFVELRESKLHDGNLV